MTTSWGDYCGGFSYQIEYVSGSFSPVPTQSQLDSFLVLDTATMTVTVTTTDPAWTGTHVIKIKGTNGAASKVYNSVYSTDISIEFVNPCYVESNIVAQSIADIDYQLKSTA